VLEDHQRADLELAEVALGVLVEPLLRRLQAPLESAASGRLRGAEFARGELVAADAVALELEGRRFGDRFHVRQLHGRRHRRGRRSRRRRRSRR
jgi:hypothetical protein